MTALVTLLLVACLVVFCDALVRPEPNRRIGQASFVMAAASTPPVVALGRADQWAFAFCMAATVAGYVLAGIAHGANQR